MVKISYTSGVKNMDIKGPYMERRMLFKQILGCLTANRD